MFAADIQDKTTWNRQTSLFFIQIARLKIHYFYSIFFTHSIILTSKMILIFYFNYFYFYYCYDYLHWKQVKWAYILWLLVTEFCVRRRGKMSHKGELSIPLYQLFVFNLESHYGNGSSFVIKWLSLKKALQEYTVTSSLYLVT